MNKTKRTKKIMTVPIPRPEAASDPKDIIGALKSLQASRGWAVILGILDDNIAYLEKAILDKIDPRTKLPLSETEIEDARTKRSLNIELRDIPKEYTKVVKENGGVPPEYDPYFKTNDEIIRAQGAPVPDDGGE